MKKSLIFIIVFLFGFYFGYKGINLYYYNLNNVSDETNITIKNTITIHKQPVLNDDYLEFKDIKIKNEFANFVKLDYPESTNDSVKYIYTDSNLSSSIKASFWISITDSYVDMLKSDATLFDNDGKKITNDSLKKYLEKNKINNDIELFQFLENKKTNKNNIFTSVSKMRDNYTFNFIVSILLPTIENITLIDGDYIGYILNLKNNIKEAHILENGKNYVFLFMNTEYFTDSDIEEILSTIEFLNLGHVKEIVDLIKDIDDFVCAEALENFYSDNNYTYYYPCIKGDYVVVRYENGYEETVKEALEKSRIKIEDLDTYKIEYSIWQNK